MNELDGHPHGSALRKGRVSLPNHAYFVTKCAKPDVKDVLVRPDCAKLIADALLWARDNGWWRMLGFVIMPGHYHLGIGLGELKNLSDAIAGLDRHTAIRMNQILGRTGRFWEDGFYDHAIRDRTDLDGIVDYIHRNPVEAGLVESAEQWEWSTAHPIYAGEIDWDWVGIGLPRQVEGARRFDPKSIL